jgi:hypothetical protein
MCDIIASVIVLYALSGSKGGSLFIFNTEGWDYLPIIENNNIREGLALQVAYEANVRQK